MDISKKPFPWIWIAIISIVILVVIGLLYQQKKKSQPAYTSKDVTPLPSTTSTQITITSTTSPTSLKYPLSQRMLRSFVDKENDLPPVSQSMMRFRNKEEEAEKKKDEERKTKPVKKLEKIPYSALDKEKLMKNIFTYLNNMSSLPAEFKDLIREKIATTHSTNLHLLQLLQQLRIRDSFMEFKTRVVPKTEYVLDLECTDSDFGLDRPKYDKPTETQPSPYPTSVPDKRQASMYEKVTLSPIEMPGKIDVTLSPIEMPIPPGKLTPPPPPTPITIPEDNNTRQSEDTRAFLRKMVNKAYLPIACVMAKESLKPKYNPDILLSCFILILNLKNIPNDEPLTNLFEIIKIDDNPANDRYLIGGNLRHELVMNADKIIRYFGMGTGIVPDESLLEYMKMLVSASPEQAFVFRMTETPMDIDTFSKLCVALGQNINRQILNDPYSGPLCKKICDVPELQPELSRADVATGVTESFRY